MAFEFKNIMAAMGLSSKGDQVTEAHLQAADDKIAKLEQEKASADTRAQEAEAARITAQTALDTARTEAATAATNLQAEQEKVTTLENWKKEQQATDGRKEDDSNDLDGDDQGPKAAWETAGAAAIASVKKRLGDK